MARHGQREQLVVVRAAAIARRFARHRRASFRDRRGCSRTPSSGGGLSSVIQAGRTSGVAAAAAFALTHVAAGCALALLLIGHRRLLTLIYARTSADPGQFSLHPFNVERDDVHVRCAAAARRRVVVRRAPAPLRGHVVARRQPRMGAARRDRPVLGGARGCGRLGRRWPRCLAGHVADAGYCRYGSRRPRAAPWAAAAPRIAGDASQCPVPGPGSAGIGVLPGDGGALGADDRARDHRAAGPTGAVASRSAPGRVASIAGADRRILWSARTARHRPQGAWRSTIERCRIHGVAPDRARTASADFVGRAVCARWIARQPLRPQPAG